MVQEIDIMPPRKRARDSTEELLVPMHFLRRGLTAIALTLIGSGMRAQPRGPVGCYRFDRPLGSSATGNVERGDSTWYVVQLLRGGRVRLPALESAYWRTEYANRSAWRTTGDTVHLRVSTGLVGWDVVLAPSGDSYTGLATYLTDATGGAPYIVGVHAKREECPSPAAGTGHHTE